MAKQAQPMLRGHGLETFPLPFREKFDALKLWIRLNDLLLSTSI
jgi:hypothetical protein